MVTGSNRYQFSSNDSALRALRTESELYTKELCEQAGRRRGFPDQSKRLQYLKDKNIITSDRMKLQLNIVGVVIVGLLSVFREGGDNHGNIT